MMAHEVNNSIGPINSILDSLHFYQSQLQPDHQEEYTNALEVAVARNQKLNRFMRNFADVVRLPSPHLESANLQQLLRDIHTLMQAYTGAKKITFQLQLPDSPITYPLDIQQMEQILPFLEHSNVYTRRLCIQDLMVDGLQDICKHVVTLQRPR